METTECALRKNSVIKRTEKKTSACAGVFFIVWETSFPYDKGVVCDTPVMCTVYTGSTRYHAAVNNVRISL